MLKTNPRGRKTNIETREDFKVLTYKIKEISKHPFADNLEIAKFGRGHQCVTGKGEFRTNDVVAFLENQMVLPQDMLRELKLEGKLSGKDFNRIKAVRLRGIASDGLLYKMPNEKVGANVREKLGIKKWVPPVPASMSGTVKNSVGKVKAFDIVNLDAVESDFIYEEKVIITEKLHGTFCGFAYQNREWFIYSKGLGKNDLSFDRNAKDNEKNVYLTIFNESFEQLEQFRGMILRDYRMDSFILFGEIIGRGIQDLYYGKTKPSIYFFDAYLGKAIDMDTHCAYLPFDELLGLLTFVGLNVVPLVTVTKFDYNYVIDIIGNCKKSKIDNETIFEGVIVKPAKERFGKNGRIIGKLLTETYRFRKQGTERQ